jgi:hypothetical protein
MSMTGMPASRTSTMRWPRTASDPISTSTLRLQRHQAVGGLAARAYGATRPLVDLDFYVRAEDLPRVLGRAGDSWVWGPEHFKDENWDLTVAKLEKHGGRGGRSSILQPEHGWVARPRRCLR